MEKLKMSEFEDKVQYAINLATYADYTRASDFLQELEKIGYVIVPINATGEMCENIRKSFKSAGSYDEMWDAAIEARPR